MEKYSYVNEGENLRKKLRKMRLIATSLLVFMAIVFVVFKKFEDRGLFYSSIAAFAEASMVGALADWFAVVALFRHPMGLRMIPHTAIIANNKPRIAKALSNFVVSNFFTPEVIKAKLDKVSIYKIIINYVLQHKKSIAEGIAKKLPVLVDAFIDDSKLEGYIKNKIAQKSSEIKLYPLIGKGLSPIIEAGYHKPLVKGMVEATYKFIADNKEKTLYVLGGINKTFAMPFIGDLVYKKILEFLDRQVEEIDTNDEVEINKLLLAALPKLLNDMGNSEELINKGEILKEQIINSQLYNELENKLVAIVIDFKNSLINNEIELANRLEDLLDRMSDSANDNTTLTEKIDKIIIENVENIVFTYGEKLGSLIYDTMDGWETKDMVNKLEVQVGADLQYIRINGTIIGGLVGLAIHYLSILL